MLRGLFFQAWGSLTSLKSQTRDHQLKVPPGGFVLMIFYVLKKIHRLQPGLNPRNLDLEAITLPRDHRGRLFSHSKCKPMQLNLLELITIALLCKQYKLRFWSYHRIINFIITYTYWLKMATKDLQNSKPWDDERWSTISIDFHNYEANCS